MKKIMKKISSLYLKTGEFAELAGLNRRTLHYYDQIGLFSPDHTGDNGYRYYSVSQLDRLALIITLRDLGVSLKDIRACLDSASTAQMNLLLEQQDQEIDRSIARLQQRQQLLRETLAENRSFAEHLGRGCYIQTWPAEHREIIWDMDPDAQNSTDIRIVNYLTDGPGTGLYLAGGRHFLYQKRESGSSTSPAGRYFCCCQAMPADTEILAQLDSAAEDLRRQAGLQSIELEADSLIEFNDCSALGDAGKQHFRIRARIREQTENSAHQT